MRAIRVTAFGGPEVLTLAEVPDPQPGPGQIRVRNHAVGINPVEAYVRAGTYASKPSLPYTPGSDSAGVVDALGEGVSGLAVGDRVYQAGPMAASTGAYAELTVNDARNVHALPASLSFQQGAAVGVPCSTAWRALFQKAGVVAGETVLIHGGSGAVGTAAIQLARAAGLTVIATAGTAKGLELVTSLGAQHAVDHSQPDAAAAIKAAAGGRGPDVIIEMLANVNLARDAELLAPRGRIVVVGSRGSLDFAPRLLMGKEASVFGMTLPNMTADEWRTVNTGVQTALAAGTLKPVVNRELPLAEAAKAHEAVMAGGAAGKIVLVP
ncbi:MAG: NADPH:quinone reductase [Vicinamibacteraceae bacterium]